MGLGNAGAQGGGFVGTATSDLAMASNNVTGLGAGLVSAPSVAWAGASSNTGLYQSAGADSIGFAVDGTKRVELAGQNLNLTAVTLDWNAGSGTTTMTGNSTSQTFYAGSSIAAFLTSDGVEAYAGRLTAGTLTQAKMTQLRHAISTFTWTNAMVAALGAVTLGDLAVCTLPAKTIVINAYVIINTAETALAGTFTVALGRTGATYIDYIVASNAKAAANTVYGDVSGERGTNLTGYDLPSWTGTTAVNVHFISSVGNLSTVANTTGTVVLETATIP